MMSRNDRLLQIGCFLVAAWQFLSIGGITASAVVMFGLQQDAFSLTLFAIAAYCLWVGWLSLARLKALLAAPHY